MTLARLLAATMCLATAMLSCVGCSSKDFATTSQNPAPVNTAGGPIRPGAPTTTANVNGPSTPKPASSSNETPPGRLAEDLTKVEPKFKLTADEFKQEFQKDEKAAAKKFKDAVIELSGTSDDSGGPDPHSRGSVLTLKAGKFALVRCMMVEGEPWAKVADGSKVIIKGKASGSDPEALYGCVFVEIGSNPASVVKAEDLVNEFAIDKVKAEAKYSSKPLIIDCEVLSVGTDEEKFNRILVKGDGKTDLNCRLNTFLKLPIELKAGQRIRIATKGAGFQKSQLVVTQCKPITGTK